MTNKKVYDCGEVLQGITCCSGDKNRKRTLDSPLPLSQLAAREVFLAFPFFLSHSNIIFPPK